MKQQTDSYKARREIVTNIYNMIDDLKSEINKNALLHEQIIMGLTPENEDPYDLTIDYTPEMIQERDEFLRCGTEIRKILKNHICEDLLGLTCEEKVDPHWFSMSGIAD